MSSRPYKEDSPINTINKIRNLLYNIDVNPFEQRWANPYGGIYSMRLDLGKDYNNWGTNGKGLTQEYCLASAYGEFIERLQNNMFFCLKPRIFYDRLKEKYGFAFAKDEEYLTYEEFSEIPDSIYNDIIEPYLPREQSCQYFDSIRNWNSNYCLALPFKEINTENVVKIPYIFLYQALGSNGMSAGNTLDEAKFQGLCEVAERAAVANIGYNNLCPPNIDRSIIKKFSSCYELIQKIERNKEFKIVVKDLSLGKGLPVVGTILINIKNNRYRFNAGSDTNLETAINRTLTEIYQGIKDEATMTSIMHLVPCDIEEDIYQKSNKTRISDELQKFFINGAGLMPMSLFSDDPDWDFCQKTFINRESYSAEVEYLTSIFKSMNTKIYFRDASFLGFPSVFIYCPKYSPIGKKNTRESNFSEHTSNLAYYFYKDIIPGIISGSEFSYLSRLDSAIVNSKTSNSTVAKAFGLELYENATWNRMEISFFMCLLWYRSNDIERAYDWFMKFIQIRGYDLEELTNTYYGAVKLYFELLIENLDSDSIESKLLDEGFNLRLVEKTINDLRDRKNIFKNVKYPSCPNCESCDMRVNCKLNAPYILADKLFSYISKTTNC